MPLTLDDLRTPQTAAIIRARILARLQAAGAPTAAWVSTASGGVENSAVDMLASALEQLASAKIADAASGRFLDFATGDFLRFLAKRYYQLDARSETFTVQNVRLTSVPGNSQQSFEPGDLWVMAKGTGHRYQSITGGELLPGQTLDLKFQAEFAGSAYADVAGAITSMVTAPAGISCTNVRPSPFLSSRLTGASTGTVSGGFAIPGVRPDFDSIRIRIVTSGEVGSATFEFSTDGGASWAFGGAIPPLFAGAAGAIVTFFNGVAPSFIVGNIFTLLVADAILIQGADAESDDSIRVRCRARRATLSDVPTAAVFQLWAAEASQEVSKTAVDADPNTPGGVLVTIASHAGPASAAAVIDVSDFIAARLAYKNMPAPGGGFSSPQETVLVRSAKRREITTAGIVSVPRDNVAAVQLAAETLWIAYLQGLGLGPSTARLSELQQAIEDAGAITFSGLTLNGVAGNVAIADGEVAVPAAGTSLLTSLMWRPV